MRAVVTLLLSMGFAPVAAALAPGEPLPNADHVAREVEFVNRFQAVRNIRYGDERHRVVVLDLSAGGRLVTNTFERWRRNDYTASDRVAARDLAIFRSGKLRGTGILVTDYTDASAGRAYAIWLPSLRKIRRFAEPDPADSWGNSNFSYGDVYTRRAGDESHELLGREVFTDCLGVLSLPEAQRSRHTRRIPEPDCSVQGRQVYRLLSRPRRPDPGYDERTVWVDVNTFADYRSVYYRAGEVQKVIDKSWRSMRKPDPRAQFWAYWYAYTPSTGQQGMAFVVPEAVHWDEPLEPGLWSERTLRQIRR